MSETFDGLNALMDTSLSGSASETTGRKNRFRQHSERRGIYR
ncbi:hypothetical protein [Morganella morganii]